MIKPLDFSKKNIGSLLFLDRPVIVVGTISLLGALLRISFATARSLWLDEAKLFWIAQGTLREVIDQNAISNSAPPTYALLINLATSVSDSELALRSLSIVFGVISIPLMFMLARRFTSKYPAYLCALIVAISVVPIRFSLELREYSLTFLVATAVLLSFHKFLYEPDWKNWLLLASFLVICILVQYGLALLVLSLNLVMIAFLALYSRNRKTNQTLFVRWVLAQLFVLGAIIVVYKLSLERQFVVGGFGAESYLQSAYWNGSPRSLVRLAVFNTYKIFEFAYPFPFLLLLFFGIGVFYALRSRRLRVAILLLIIPMAVSFISALMRIYPYYGGRQLMFLSPMIFVFVGLGFDHLLKLSQSEEQPTIRIAVALVTMFLFIVSGLGVTLSYYLNDGVSLPGDVIEDIKPLVNLLDESYKSGDYIYVGCRAAPAFSYYHRANFERWIVREGNTIDDYYDQLDAPLAKPDRIWLISSHCTRADEHKLVAQYASQTRDVQLVSSRRGAWLYLVN